MNQNNDDLINTDIDNTNPDISKEDQAKYQQILDEYSQQLESKPDQKNLDQHKIPPQDNTDYVSPSPPPPAPVSMPTEVFTPPQVPKLETDTNTLPPPIKNEEEAGLSLPQTDMSLPIKNEEEADLPIPQIDEPSPDSPKPTPKKFNLFKYLFYISVIVFITLVVLLVKDYLILQSVNNSSVPNLLPTVSPVVDNIDSQTTGCVLNEVNYQIGDTVPSQDKCNVCTCQQTESDPEVICSLLEDCQN